MVAQLLRGTGSKSVGLRADLDALPIVETNTFGYANLLEKRVCEIANAQAQRFCARAEIDYQRNYPVVINTTAESEFAAAVAREPVSEDQIKQNPPPLMASEGFAFMLEKLPGCYLFIGNGDGDSAGACMVHNPGYNFNDENIGIGSAYWALLVERFLK